MRSMCVDGCLLSAVFGMWRKKMLNNAEPTSVVQLESSVVQEPWSRPRVRVPSSVGRSLVQLRQTLQTQFGLCVLALLNKCFKSAWKDDFRAERVAAMLISKQNRFNRPGAGIAEFCLEVLNASGGRVTFEVVCQLPCSVANTSSTHQIHEWQRQAGLEVAHALLS